MRNYSNYLLIRCEHATGQCAGREEKVMNSFIHAEAFLVFPLISTTGGGSRRMRG